MRKGYVVSYYIAFLCGGDKRDRTADLLHAMQALSQLSYTPMITKDDITISWTYRNSNTKINRSLYDFRMKA